MFEFSCTEFNTNQKNMVSDLQFCIDFPILICSGGFCWNPDIEILALEKKVVTFDSMIFFDSVKNKNPENRASFDRIL